MATRLQVTLDSAERSALDELAAEELRDSRDQLRHILRKELERRGLLPSGDSDSEAPRSQAAAKPLQATVFRQGGQG